jgi:hypothetical protein
VPYPPGEVFEAGAEKRTRWRLSTPNNIVSLGLIAPFGKSAPIALRAMIVGR